MPPVDDGRGARTGPGTPPPCDSTQAPKLFSQLVKAVVSSQGCILHAAPVVKVRVIKSDHGTYVPKKASCISDVRRAGRPAAHFRGHRAPLPVPVATVTAHDARSCQPAAWHMASTCTPAGAPPLPADPVSLLRGREGPLHPHCCTTTRAMASCSLLVEHAWTPLPRLGSCGSSAASEPLRSWGAAQRTFWGWLAGAGGPASEPRRPELRGASLPQGVAAIWCPLRTGRLGGGPWHRRATSGRRASRGLQTAQVGCICLLRVRCRRAQRWPALACR